MNLCDIKTIKELMTLFGLSPRREFGQNFLTDRRVVESIAELCCEGVSENILEIGPGIGTLTAPLAERYKNVVAIEIDRGLIPLLSYTLGRFSNVKIVCKDALKCDLRSLAEPYLKGGLSVCANLPYYITTPILTHLLKSNIPFDYITVMVQSEVADKLFAHPGSNNYGATTVALNYYGSAEKLVKVPAGAFLPPPKVSSTVVRIKLHKEKPAVPENEEVLFRIIKAAFGQRRKTLPNALSTGFPELERDEITESVIACGHSPNERGECLGIAEFVLLSDEINRRIR